MITTPINTTLVATGGTAGLISLPAGETCRGWVVQARGAVDMLISDVAAMTTYYTLKSGQSIYLEDILGPGANLFYAISSGAESFVELIRVRRY